MAQNQYPFEFQTSFGEADLYDQMAKRLLAMTGEAPQGKMVSGHYVRTNPMQHIARLFGQWQAGRAMDTAGAMRTGTMRRMGEAEASQMADIRHTARGVPAGNDVGPPDAQGGMGYSPGVPGDYGAAATLAASSPFKNVQEQGKDYRSMWQTMMATGAGGASDEAKVRAGLTGKPPTEAKPEERYGAVGNVAPQGMRPVMGQKDERTGKVRFGPAEPTQVQVGNYAAREDQALVRDHYKMLTDPKMRDTAVKASEALSTATQALNMIAKVPMNMGQGAGAITEVQKAAKWLGKPVDPRAAASEVYASLVVPMVGQAITAFGSGTGLSDADREFAKQSAALLQRDPRAAQAILFDLIKRSWKYADNYRMMTGAGEGLAKSAGMNPDIFKSIALPFDFKVAKELNLPDNPYEWPDAYGAIQQSTQPAPTPQNPPARRW